MDVTFSLCKMMALPWVTFLSLALMNHLYQVLKSLPKVFICPLWKPCCNKYPILLFSILYTTRCRLSVIIYDQYTKFVFIYCCPIKWWQIRHDKWTFSYTNNTLSCSWKIQTKPYWKVIRSYPGDNNDIKIGTMKEKAIILMLLMTSTAPNWYQ